MRHVIAAFRTFAAFIFFLVFAMSFVLFSALTLRKWSLRSSGPALRFMGRVTLKILGIKFTLTNAWPFTEDEARVVIVNHQSTLDLIWFSALTPNRLGAVGKRELAWVPIMNLAWWALRFFYIDRSDNESAIRTMNMAAENTVLHRRSVSLSPEGTRSKDGRILPFKKGVFHLALAGRLPIYPVIVCGATEAMPKHTLFAYPHPISVRFLPPISTKDWDPELLDQHIDKVRETMMVAYEELRLEVGLPPLPADS